MPAGNGVHQRSGAARGLDSAWRVAKGSPAVLEKDRGAEDAAEG